MSDQQLDWNTLAQTKASDVERPPLKPVGHYQAIINGRAEQGASSKKGTLFAKFPVQVMEPLEDVDQEELASSGGCPFKGDVTFWLSPNALWMFTEFATGMGLSDDLSIVEQIEALASLGEPFVLEAKHEPNERNPDRPFLRLENPIPLSVWQERQSQQAD